MSDLCQESLDPRIRRTRHLLHQALAKLLESKAFENISVQDITDAATVNRATFYDHYADKFALLTAMAGERFWALLTQRGVRFDGGCSSALKAIVMGVCDYLAAAPGATSQRQIEPHMETAVIGVVRFMLLDGLANHQAGNDWASSPELIATAMSWAIYGAAREWLNTPNRCPSEEIVDTIVSLLSPILFPSKVSTLF